MIMDRVVVIRIIFYSVNYKKVQSEYLESKKKPAKTLAFL